MMTDPIADMLTRIRNSTMARHDRVEMPHSRLKERVASVMKAEGYLDDIRVSEGEERKTLTLVLRYGRDRESAIDGLRRVSTPGRRVYVAHDRIDRVC
jgi:small subunit ribosomal protein S8